MIEWRSTWSSPFGFILVAPLIFPMHVAEETASGFVAWFNSLAQPSITQSMFLTVNVVAFLITALVAAMVAGTRSRPALLVAAGWLSFLFFANAVFHLVGTIVHGRYSPGTATALLLYLPFFVRFCWLCAAQAEVRLAAMLVTCGLCAMPMLAHGYMIIFEGGRLF